ncbi:MAG TPA: response regulator [Magnetospirillaceae bacterium]|jgi:CheY-like chemotaxis protein
MPRNTFTPFRNIRILAVDDLIETRDLTREMLGAIGFRRVETARNGEDAYRRFVLNPAALVVTDLRMGPVDGLQLTRLIRTAPDSPNRFVPIMVLSCITDVETIGRARDAGVNDFLAKPLAIATLRTHLEWLIERPAKFVRSGTYFGPDRRLHAPTPRLHERRSSMMGVTPLPDATRSANASHSDRAHHSTVEQDALARNVDGFF